MCAEPLRRVGAIQVATCRREDLGEVEKILKAAPEAAAWTKDALEDTFEGSPAHFLVGRQGEEIAGFIAGRRAGDEGEILNLAVKQQYRRQGVGRALAKALIELFAQDAVLQVFLEVRESNAEALALYQGLGFRKVGRREGYYREPEEAAVVLAMRI
jgi:ribosomal-protein-alanine N-acetyltransferase